MKAKIVDLASDIGVIEKTGAWYSYNGEKLGQGKENVKELLKKNVALKEELLKKVRNYYELDTNESSKSSKVKEEIAE